MSNWRNWKIVSRTEWQGLLVSIGVLVANRLFDIGLTEADIYAMFGGVGTYAVSRGVAKNGNDKPVKAIEAPAEVPVETPSS